MDVHTAIHGRRSIQKYQDRPVEYDKVCDIVEAGQAAPSAGALHITKYIIILDQGRREQIAEACLGQLWMAKAPVHIIACAEVDKTEQMFGLRGERLYAIQDCAASIQNMLLKAYELGLGTCWVSGFDEDMIKRLCNIPTPVRPQAVITLGYPDEKPEPKPNYPLYQVFFFDNWGGKLRNIHRIFRQHSIELEMQAKKAAESIKNAVGKKLKREEE